MPDEDLELPSWVGSVVDDGTEVTSENVEAWLREHWAADIEFDLPRSIGEIIEDDGELTSQDVDEWLRRNWHSE